MTCGFLPRAAAVAVLAMWFLSGGAPQAAAGDSIGRPGPDRYILTAQADAAASLNRRNRIRVQRALKALGFDPGRDDGLFTAPTREAIAAYQKDQGAPATGRLTEQELRALLAGAAKARAKRPVRRTQKSSYDTDAIHARIRSIIDGYRPASPLADRQGIGQTFAEDDTILEDLRRLPDTAAVDIDGTLFKANPDHGRYPRNDILKISGLHDYPPSMKAVVNDAHRAGIAGLRSPTGTSDEDRIAAARKGMSQLVSAATQARARYGPDHPLTGFILSDLAAITTRTVDYNDLTDTVRQLERQRHRDAARLLGRPVTAARAVQNALAEAAIDNHLRAAQGANCRFSGFSQETAADFRMAAAVHHRQFGPALEQIGWLQSASDCTSDAAQRVRLLRAASALARRLDHDTAKAILHANLGTAHFQAGDREAASLHLKESMRLHATRVRRARDDFYYMGSTVSGPQSDALPDALEALGLDAELDLLFAWTIEHQIRTKEYSNNAGMSYVTGLIFALEDRERFDLVDDFYAFLDGLYYGGGDRIDGRPPVPVEKLVQAMAGFADELIARENYSAALKLLERAGGKFDEARFPALAAHIYSLFARAHEEQGAYDSALDYAKRALKIAQTHTVDRVWVDVTELERMVTAATLESGGVLNTILARIDEGTQQACGGNGSRPKLFPLLPVDQLAADIYLARDLVRNPAIVRYIACFRRIARDMEDQYTEDGTTLLAMAPRDVMYVLGLAGDRETATEILESLIERRRWGLGPPVTTPTKERNNTETSRLTAITGAIDGLILGNAGTWFLPYVRVLDGELAEAHLAYLLGVTYAVDQVSSLGLQLYSLGETQAADRLYRAVLAWSAKEQAEPGSIHGECFDVGECELLAMGHLQHGETARAEKLLDKVPTKFMVMWSGASASASEMDAMATLALTEGLKHERRGHHVLAKIYYEFAGSSADGFVKLEDPFRSFDDVRAADALTRIAYKTGDLEDARRISGQFVTAAKKRIDSLNTFSSDLLVRWSHRLRGVFETHLNTLPVDGDGFIEGGEDAFFAMQYLQTTRAAVTFTRLAARMGANAGEAARAHQDLSAELSDAYGALINTPKEKAQGLLRRIEGLETRMRRLEEKLRAEDPAYFQHGRLQFVSLADLQKLLRPGEAVLSTFAGEDYAYLWLITPERHTLQRLDVRPQALARAIRSLRKRIGADDASPDVDALFKVPLLQFFQLYRTVFGGLEDKLKGIDQLIYVPHGVFDGLPLATLLTERPPKPSMTIGEIRDAKLPWLIRSMAISAMPSLGAIRVLRDGSLKSAAELPFLGLGNPRFGDGLDIAPAPTRALDPKRVTMAPLPETETEVTRLASLLDADPKRDLLLDEAASETRLKQTQLDRYRIIALATHGLLAGEVQGLDEPAIVLAKPKQTTKRDDGLLRASEVVDLKLDADLVLLSACNTASGDGTPGAEGLSGLANAFFYAGARNLVVTHWYIPSLAAVDITVGMMETKRAAPATSWARALQRSVLALIDGDGPPGHAHPRAWGAHMVVGVPE